MVKTYKMRKFDAEKLGSVKKVKLITDNDNEENVVKDIMKNINAMASNHKGKKLKFQL